MIDVFFESVMQAYSQKENSSSSNRAQTCIFFKNEILVGYSCSSSFTEINRPVHGAGFYYRNVSIAVEVAY